MTQNFKRDAARIRKAVLQDQVRAAGIKLGQDPHAVSISDKNRLAEMAKAAGYRKSVSSPFSLGTAFYVYLSRGL